METDDPKFFALSTPTARTVIVAPFYHHQLDEICIGISFRTLTSRNYLVQPSNRRNLGVNCVA